MEIKSESFFIFTLDQIIVLNKYYTYNKPIPKILHVKTLQTHFAASFVHISSILPGSI